jgi:hypothetical protein
MLLTVKAEPEGCDTDARVEKGRQGSFRTLSLLQTLPYFAVASVSFHELQQTASAVFSGSRVS